MPIQQLKLSAELAARADARHQPDFAPPPRVLRPEMVARGRLLAVDPAYPSAKIMLLVGRHLVKLIG